MANRKQRQHQSGNPAIRAAGGPPVSRAPRSAPVPTGSRWRAALDRRSAPVLLAMHTLPRWVIPVVMGLVLAGGLFLEGAWLWLGTLLLGLVTLLVGWLYTLSWPVLPIGGRIGRGLVVIGLAGLTLLKATGRL